MKVLNRVRSWFWGVFVSLAGGAANEETSPLLGAETSAADIEQFERDAANGNADSQYRLGVCYYEGQGVSQDYADAVKWLEKAAAQGFANAAAKLRELLRNQQR